MPEESSAVMVPMEVKYSPGWLTWVASTTTCLRALGIECDNADVAGLSGYAFHLCVSPELCPSGPTVLDWDALNWGVRYLGRSALEFYGGECHGGENTNDRTRAHCRAAFDMVRREIEAGRPCVIWGAYVPEFAVAVGVDGDAYIVRSFKECIGEDQPPIPCEEVDAPGGPYALAFPTPSLRRVRQGDRYAVCRAVQMFSRSPRTHRFGAAAYDLWIESLEAKRAVSFGNAYNAACYAEGRRFAHEFISRLADRNAFAEKQLRRASESYAVAADAMARIARLFPFPGGGQIAIEEDEVIREAVRALREAKDAECSAIEELAAVTEMEWPKE